MFSCVVLFKVIIVGQQDQGKSTLAQILATYAVRLDRNPIYVDLDVSQGLFTIPGTLSAVPLTKTMLSPEVIELFLEISFLALLKYTISLGRIFQYQSLNLFLWTYKSERKCGFV